MISPIFKSGNKTECTNYRPISILSAISKIFEKLISMQLSEYLESNEILTGEQSGFRKNHSTQSSLLQATNKLVDQYGQRVLEWRNIFGPEESL